MSLPEIIPSNLPIFVQNKNRSSFANSVIPSGAVLLFAESDGNGGSKLIAKNPDGSFSEVGGGSTPFYKCASIDTTNHRWTGYLASVDPVTGVWSFAETATSGLTYDRIIPVVGSVYDEGCTFLVTKYNTGLPEDGLVFYLPLDEDPGSTDVTGKLLSFRNVGNIQYGQVVQGLTCTKFGITSAIRGPDFSSILPNNSSTEFTLSVFQSVDGSRAYGFGFCDTSETSGGDIPKTGLYPSNPFSVYAGSKSSTRCTVPWMSGFHHLALTFGSNTVKAYVDGSYTSQGSYYSSDNPFGDVSEYQPAVQGNWDNPCNVYYLAFRVYNRVLDSSEIEALANEFTPTPAS